MQRNARIMKATAVALTNPAPEFVSLVKAGANKTPFKAVKTEENDGDNTMNVRVRQRSKATALDPTLTHPLKGQSVKADGMSIAKIDFIKGNTFPDELAVKSWLDEGGYSDYDVETVDGGWAVANKSEEFDGALRTIDMGGAVISIGKVKGTAEAEKTGEVTDAVGEGVPEVTAVNPVAKSDGEVEAPVAETSEVKKKFDSYCAAYYSDSGSFSDAVMAGMYDGLPPGMYDLTQALYGAISNCVKSGNVEGIKTAANDYASVVVTFVNALASLDVDGATEAAKAEKSETRERVIKAALPDLPIVAAKADADGGAGSDGDGDEDGDTNPKDDKTSKAKEEPVATEQAGDLQPIELKQFDISGPIAEAMKEAMTPVAAALATLAATVSTLAEKSTKSAEDLSTRVEAIETRAQTRKGAGVDDANVTPTTPAKKADTARVDELARRGMLGI